MPSRPREPALSASWRTASLVLLVGVGVLLVVLAAGTPASHPFSARATHATVAPTSVSPRADDPRPAAPRPSQGGTHSPWWATAVLALAFLGALALALRALLRHLRFRRRRRVSVLPDSGLVGRPVTASSPVVAAALADALPALDDRGPVAAAVIAFWIAVGESLRRAGVPARPAETTTEFVERVLGEVGGAAGALRELSELYREARFSTHTMTEDQRASARDCAVRIRDDLAGVRRG